MDSPKFNPALAVLMLLGLLALAGLALVSLYRATSLEFFLGFLTLVVTFSTTLLQFRNASLRDAKTRLFPEKSKAYGRLLRYLMELIQAQKNKSLPPQQVLEKDLSEIKTELLIWGSYETIRVLDSLGEKLPNGDPLQFIDWMAALLGAVRKDLDHADPLNASLDLALGLIRIEDRILLKQALHERRHKKK